MEREYWLNPIKHGSMWMCQGLTEGRVFYQTGLCYNTRDEAVEHTKAMIQQLHPDMVKVQF